MTQPLLPCPFCNWPDVILVEGQRAYHPTRVMVHCPNCDADGPLEKDGSLNWNSRAVPTHITTDNSAVIATLQAELDALKAERDSAPPLGSELMLTLQSENAALRKQNSLVAEISKRLATVAGHSFLCESPVAGGCSCGLMETISELYTALTSPACPECGGKGFKEEDNEYSLDDEVISMPCPSCSGTGDKTLFEVTQP